LRKNNVTKEKIAGYTEMYTYIHIYIYMYIYIGVLEYFRNKKKIHEINNLNYTNMPNDLNRRVHSSDAYYTFLKKRNALLFLNITKHYVRNP